MSVWSNRLKICGLVIMGLSLFADLYGGNNPRYNACFALWILYASTTENVKILFWNMIFVLLSIVTDITNAAIWGHDVDLNVSQMNPDTTTYLRVRINAQAFCFSMFVITMFVKVAALVVANFMYRESGGTMTSWRNNEKKEDQTTGYYAPPMPQASFPEHAL